MYTLQWLLDHGGAPNLVPFLDLPCLLPFSYAVENSHCSDCGGVPDFPRSDTSEGQLLETHAALKNLPK